MNRREHLLTILAEECVETAQRATKALRFGLSETQPGQEFTNAQRMFLEYTDILAIMKMLIDEGILAEAGVVTFTDEKMREIINNKINRVEKYLKYSHQCGTLSDI